MVEVLYLKSTHRGTNYSVTCLTRTITNPVVTSVMLTATTKPTTKGYYIFSVTPTDGLPVGVSPNDIVYFDGTTWSVFQKYSVASAVLVAGTTTNTQVTWRKFNGRWMSTADDFIPDGKEYQTGKLWNGKAVYRVCISATTAASVGAQKSLAPDVTIPLTGTVLMVLATIDDAAHNRSTMGRTGDQIFRVNSVGKIYHDVIANSGFCNIPCVVWVEYTKS